MISITMRYFDLEQTSLDDKISHKTLIREILNQVNLNQISHKTFNREILNHTMRYFDLDEISLLISITVRYFDFDEISHDIYNHEIS